MKLYKFIKIFLFIIAIMVLSLYISVYWFQVMLIQGSSMEPTYHNWQFVLLYKDINELENNMVIAFRSDNLDAVLIKRIVACPGDMLYIKDGRLFVNDLLSDNISNNVPISYSGIACNVISLAENEYFVLGDNYESSRDSRYEEIGIVKSDDIMGIVVPQKALERDQDLSSSPSHR